MGHTEADCQALLERLYLYLDDEIEGGECARIIAHLEGCERCFKRVEFERALKLVVKRSCSGSGLPEGLVERLRAELRPDAS